MRTFARQMKSRPCKSLTFGGAMESPHTLPPGNGHCIHLNEGRATNRTTNYHLESTAAALGTLDHMEPSLAAIVLDSPPLWKLPS
jgi:hypothetical protein